MLVSLSKAIEDLRYEPEPVGCSGIETRGSCGSMNRGPELLGAPSSWATKIRQEGEGREGEAPKLLLNQGPS